MIELIVTLLIFGGSVAVSPGDESFSIERANCEDPQSHGERRVCDLSRYPDDK